LPSHSAAGAVARDLEAMAERTGATRQRTTRRARGCSKHAFAPSAQFRPRSGIVGNVTLPAQGHNRAHPRAQFASGTSVVGDDPVNITDPLGLWGWNPISDVTQAAGDVGHYVVTHKKGIEIGVGIGLGVLAAGTGVGAIIEGATVAGVLLGAGSVAAGVGAGVLDYGPCVNGHEAAACLGLGLGASGAFAGAFGFAGAGLALGGVVAEDSLLAAIFGGIGAFGLNVGLAGTAVDVGSAFANTAQVCSAS
jgi:hypothetical protein